MASQKTLPADGFVKLSNSYITSGAMARVDPSAWKVLCVLAARCMSKSSCWPSVACLSADTGVSERHVVRCISELEREGLLSVEKRAGANTVYTLVQPQTPDTMSPLTPCHPCHDVTPTHDIMSPPPLTPCHPNKTKSKKTNQEDSPTDVGGLFADDELGPKVSEPKPARKTKAEDGIKHPTDVQRVVDGCYAVVGSKPVQYNAEVRAARDLLKAFDNDVERIIAIYKLWYLSDHYGPPTLPNFARYAPEVAAKMDGTDPQRQNMQSKQPARHAYSPPELTREERKALSDAFDKCDRKPAASEP